MSHTPTILITGACGSIGQALARELVHSAQLLLLDLDPLALNHLDDDLRALNPAAEPILLPFDLWRSAFDRYTVLAQLIEQACGHLDALVHTATYFTNLTPISHVSPETWLHSLQVNLSAVQWLNQNLLPWLQASPRGQILISTHPEYQQEQSAYWHAYGASQAGLSALVREWQAEQSATGVTVHEIRIPWLDTPLSRNVFPAAKEHWLTPAQILHHYLEVLS